MSFIDVEITSVGKYKLEIPGSPETIEVDTANYKDVNSHLFDKISSSKGLAREFVQYFFQSGVVSKDVPTIKLKKRVNFEIILTVT